MDTYFLYANDIFLEIPEDLFYSIPTGILISYQLIPEEDFYRIYIYKFDTGISTWDCTFKHRKDYLNTLKISSVGRKTMSLDQKAEAAEIVQKLLKFYYEDISHEYTL